MSMAKKPDRTANGADPRRKVKLAPPATAARGSPCSARPSTSMPRSSTTPRARRSLRPPRSRRTLRERRQDRRRHGGRQAQVGKLVAERAKAAGVKDVVFDRGGYLYHGRVKALADAAREGGLNF